MPGSVHDKTAADQAQRSFPAGRQFHQESGFQGFAPEGVIIDQPKQKPRGQELHPAQKGRNTLLASLRVTAEHVIAGVKRCRIVKDRFRNTKPRFADLVMLVACGLHNLRATVRRSGDARRPALRH
ncbi:MAG: transposase family protein [Roseiflexus sp.]